MMATAFEKGDETRTGFWIGFWLPPAEAVTLAGTEPDPDWEAAEDLHMTLLYLGNSAQYTPDQIRAIRRSVAAFAATAPPLAGVVNGWGVFGPAKGNGQKNVLVDLFDSPDLLDWRDGLIAAVEAVGGKIRQDHGFTPHITRAYLNPADGIPPRGWIDPIPITFDTLYIRVGDTPTAYRLLGRPAVEMQENVGSADESSSLKGQPGGETAQAPLPRLVQIFTAITAEAFSKDPTAGDVHVSRPLGSDAPGPKKKPAAKPQFAVMKAEGDRRWVFGWANVVIESDKGETDLLLDHHKDMILPEDLEAAAYNFVLEFRATGEMHRGTAKGRLIESMMFTEEKMAAIGIQAGTLPVGWWIGFQIDDPEAWEKVKTGEYAMFSIQGRAIRQEVGTE